MAYVKTFALPLALAAALSAQPRAGAEDVEKQPTLEQTAKDVKELKKSSDEILQQLRSIQEQLKSVEGVRRDVDGLKTTVQSINVALNLTTEALRAKTNELADAQTQLKQVRDEFERAKAQAGKMQEQITAQAARCDGLNGEIAQLNKKLAETSRQAARLTEGTGTVRLYNTFGRTVSIVLNGREPAYRLEPGQEAVVNQVPVGNVTYEVLAPGLDLPYRRTRTLTADNPLVIEVYDVARGPIRTPPRAVP
jgi:septal ring factor EnvC (AmiA/AmiB activator)